MKQAPRPYRNQRLFRPKQRRQQHLLEVSLRADKERELRIRHAAALIFKIVIFSALAVGAWVGTKQGLRRLVWENRTFYLSDLRVTTDGTLTREQILTTGGIVEGRNIFLLDLAKVRNSLDALPQVEHVEVQRTLPNRIDVEVTERQPIAWIAAPGDTDPTASDRSFLIDARGYVMRTRKLLPDYYSLPIITGVETENIVPGKRLTAPVAPSVRESDGSVAVLRQGITAATVQAALDLIKLNADSTRWQVRSIDVSKGYCLVVTDRSRALITFGLDNLDKQLTRLYRLLDVVEPTRKELQTVNLFVERNTPVTFTEPPSEEPVPPVGAAPAKPDAAAKPGTNAGNKPSGASTPMPVRRAESVASHATPAKTRSKDSGKKTGNEALKKPFRLQGNG